MFQLEQDEGGSGDPGDAAGVEADPAQGLEGDLEQGVGPLGDRVDASDDRVERLLLVVEFADFRLLDRVTEAVAGVLAAEVGQGGNVGRAARANTLSPVRTIWESHDK